MFPGLLIEPSVPIRTHLHWKQIKSIKKIMLDCISSQTLYRTSSFILPHDLLLDRI